MVETPCYIFLNTQSNGNTKVHTLTKNPVGIKICFSDYSICCNFLCLKTRTHWWRLLPHNILYSEWNLRHFGKKSLQPEILRLRHSIFLPYQQNTFIAGVEFNCKMMKYVNSNNFQLF